MAALLTVGAIILGVVVGLTNGGSLDQVRHYRPQLWTAALGGLLLQLILRVSGLHGGWAVLIDLVSTIALLAAATANVRLGGMILVVVGLSLNLVPTVVNWGMPTSRDALITADIVKATDEDITLEGPRHVATDSDTFSWLGETIALPTGQVISFGDVLLQFGYLLVTASLLRGRVLRHPGSDTYRRRIAPLGQGPAQRRGPGLHPSRLDAKLLRCRSRPRVPDADEVLDDEE